MTTSYQKETGKVRRAARRATWKVQIPSQAPKDGMVRLTEKLSRYSAGRLSRFIQQSARRASTAKHLLAKLHELSVFRPALLAQQKHNLISFVAASAEMDNRGKAIQTTAG